MPKIALVLIVVIFAAMAVFAAVLFWQKPTTLVDSPENGQNIKPVVLDYKNATYIIENQPVKLNNGYSEIEAAPGSASKITTEYFGNEVMGDLNGDGAPDVALLLTQETGGSGVFYYLAAALKTDTGVKPTNAVFLGDRIAPQTTEIHDGIITVNYADRKLTEPMTKAPSIGVSKYFKILNGNLVGQDAPVILGNCYIGGCSSQICSNQKDVVTTCEYKEEYACYQTATCARQSNNQCGWTQTPELTACLSRK